jgi:hypothetical protein
MEFHPEFGYLAPAPQFRRVLRIAAIAAVLGVVFGAASVSTLMARRDHAAAAAAVAAAAEPALLVQVDDLAPQPRGVVRADTNNVPPAIAVASKPADVPAEAKPTTTPAVTSETVRPSEPAVSPTKPRKTASRKTRSRSRERNEFDPGNAYAASAGTQPGWWDWREREDGRSRRQWRQDRLDGGNRLQPDPWRRSRDGWSW